MFIVFVCAVASRAIQTDAHTAAKEKERQKEKKGMRLSRTSGKAYNSPAGKVLLSKIWSRTDYIYIFL